MAQTGPKIVVKFQGTNAADLPPIAENPPSHSTTAERSPEVSEKIESNLQFTKKRSSQTHTLEEERPRQHPRRIPTPGATQAAIARLAELKCQPLPRTTTAQLPTRVSTPGAAPGTNQFSKQKISSTPSPTLPPGSKRIHAPGATQAAIARLAALNANNPSTASRGIHSSKSAFPPGTVVWAKMQSYPWWPAQVQVPSPEQARIRHTQNDVFVVFYGTADYIWLPQSDVKIFSESSPDYLKHASAKKKALQSAIDEAWRYLGRLRPDIMGKPV